MSLNNIGIAVLYIVEAGHRYNLVQNGISKYIFMA